MKEKNENKFIILIAMLTILTLFMCSCEYAQNSGNNEINNKVQNSGTTDNNDAEDGENTAPPITDNDNSNSNKSCEHSFGEWETLTAATWCQKTPKISFL